LRRLDCPPGTGAAQRQAEQALQTATNLFEQALEAARRPHFQIGGGVSSIRDIQVGNGNFNSDLNATGPAFQGELSVPIPGGFLAGNMFQARFFYFNGNASTNLNGIPGTFLQANGDNQPIPLPGSGLTDIDITRLGGELRFPFADQAAKYRRAMNWGYLEVNEIGRRIGLEPDAGLGFERITYDSETSVRIAGLNFHASDQRTTETDRLYVFGGLRAEMPVPFLPPPGAPTVFVFGRGQINFDSVRGTAVYDTAQVGVFQERLQHEFSRSVVTFGGQIGAGVAQHFANGGRFEIKGAIGSLPLHELKFHPGQPATLEHSNHLNVTAGAAVNIPLDVAPVQRLSNQRQQLMPTYRTILEPYSGTARGVPQSLQR
jgi:hypothetical protein